MAPIILVIVVALVSPGDRFRPEDSRIFRPMVPGTSPPSHSKEGRSNSSSLRNDKHMTTLEVLQVWKGKPRKKTEVFFMAVNAARLVGDTDVAKSSLA